MTSITESLNSLRSSLPAGVTLVAVSKFHPVEALMEAYRAGQRAFGESRAQELALKVKAMPADVEWHFIGHLQTNKVRAVVPHASLIHSIDSERLLRAVDAEAVKEGIVVDVLLQVHVALEETKTGFLPDDLLALANGPLPGELKGVRVRGVMGMASNVDDDARIRADFMAIADCFNRLKATALGSQPHFSIISMGMSHDWPAAVECGANMVRVGTTIFGEREY